MMIHQYLLNSLGYSIMPCDFDRNFQGHLYRNIMHLALIRGGVI